MDVHLSVTTLAILLLSSFYAVAPTKILLYPYGHCMNSHLLVVERLGAILYEKDHDMHMLINSRYKEFRPSEKEEPVFPLTLVEFQAPGNYSTVCDYDTIDYSLYSPVQERFNFFIETAAVYCERILSDGTLMKRLKAERYDLFIVEAVDPCGRILADFLDIPFIPLITTGLGHWDGNPRPPSYIPAPISPFTPNMNFLERAGNLFMKLMYESIPVIMGFDARFEELKQIYKFNTSISIADTFKRASVKLVNSDFTFEYVAPVEPDTVLVGGFAITRAKPLLGKLRAFVEGSGEYGTIIFSMGTVVKSFDEKWYKMFLDVFARFPQRVVWRFSRSSVPVGLEIPDNVLLMDWIPQNDLLAHPKVKLFITHCGLNSAMEAAYYGKPVLAMPMFADQFSQSGKLTKHAKMGIEVDLFDVTAETFHQSLTDVLSDPDYQENAEKMKKRFRDQLVSPIDKTLFWIEYVIRHGGAFHLKSQAHKLTLFQYLSLDVILVVLMIVFLILKLTTMTSKALVKFAVRRILPKEKQV